MTNEDKQLLLKDLCARLAFGRVKCQVKVLSFNEEMDEYGIELLDDEIVFIEPDIYNVYLYYEGTDVDISEIKPYLRLLSSMTDDEDKEWQSYKCSIAESCDRRLEEKINALYDWFNARHLDWRGLIPKGLAIEAPEGMYKTE